MKLIQNEQNVGKSIFDFTMGPEEVTLTTTPFGTKITVPEFTQNGNFGGPAIPSKIIKVALPDNIENVSVTWNVGRNLLLSREPLLVIPLQRPQPAPDGVPPIRIPGKPDTTKLVKRFAISNRIVPLISPVKLNTADVGKRFTAPNAALYARQRASSAQVARLLRVEDAGNNTIATIELTPLRHNQNGQLELVATGQLIITYAKESVRNQRVRVVPVNTSRLINTQITDEISQPKNLYSKSLYDLDINSRVINPGAMLSDEIKELILPCEYLIITDNGVWNENKTQGNTFSGMVSQFQKLADWKISRGLTAKVVTITDIVNGKYGNITANTLDLQEVIRNFLKWALEHWGVKWVLLGGDVNRIPARYVAGGLLGWVTRGAAEVTPEKNTASLKSVAVTSPKGNYTGYYLKVNAEEPGEWYNKDDIKYIVCRDTGAIIPFDSTGASSDSVLGWYFVTNNTYDTRSAISTNFIRINGPKKLVDVDIQILYTWNVIPTDLYYSSLNGPYDNQPGKHDWDENGNGIYGQLFFDKEIDHIKLKPDLSVGRAPVTNAAEAYNFVNKVITYEKFETPDAVALTTADIENAALLSTNWFGREYFSPPPATPPIRIPGKPVANVNKFITKNGYTLLNLGDKVVLDFSWHLYSVVSENDIRSIPFTTVSGANGWYYVKDQNNIEMSKIDITFSWGPVNYIPLPSNWIIIRSSKAEELNPLYFVLDRVEPDSSMLELEILKNQFQTKLPFKNIKRLYQDIDDLPATALAGSVATITPNSVTALLNTNQHIVCLSGHGNYDGCTDLSRAIASALTNKNKFIAYGNSCLTNAFDLDSMSKKLINNDKGGAVAYIGYSRFSWIESGDDYQRRFFEGLEYERHIGLLHDQRTLNIRNGDYFAYDVWTVLASNLLGCPEMKIWKAPPLKTVRFKPVTLENPITVKITNVRKNI